MTREKPAILVTGGAGYIGTHTVLALQQAGYRVVILDNLSQGHQALVETVLKAELVVGDIRDRPLLDRLFAIHEFIGVVHLAGSAFVAESVRDPAIYYSNNVVGTLTLLQAMVKARVQHIVFSSTCATYGIPYSQKSPIPETHPQVPINPYGTSKLMAEKILIDFDRAYGIKSVIFRFFNAAGADPVGRLGEDHTPEPHLIPRILLALLNRETREISQHDQLVSIYGTDYPTPDGTCIRDYVHVCDLAQAHYLGLAYLLSGYHSDVFNLSNDRGFSVREVIDIAAQVTGQAIPVKFGGRRVGDPAILVGNSQKARSKLVWTPRYTELVDILSHAWRWHQQRSGVKNIQRIK